MKKIFLIFFSLIFFSHLNLPAQSLSDRIEEILKDSLFVSAQIAIDVYDLTNQEYAYRKNEDLLFHPASSMKLFTTAASLLYLGIDEKFKTNFLYTGSIIDSVLNGDLVVEGGFDPMFITSDLDSLIIKLHQKGIKKINGNLLADISNIDSLYFGRGWMWDDNPNSYMPYLSSLNINKNSLKICYQPGGIGDNALIKFEPPSNYFTFENNLITTNEDTSNIKITRDWPGERNHILVQGEISYRRKSDSLQVNIKHPHLYFLQLLSEKLNKNDIPFSGKMDVLFDNTELDTLYQFNRNLIDVINETNKVSDNLNAEMLLRKLSRRFFDSSASAEKGLQLIDSLVIKLGRNPKHFVFADGSGLSHYNLVSASLIVDLLKYIYYEHPMEYRYFFNSLPIAGLDGTLEKRMKFGKAFSSVYAKTGTISGVSTLSGYVKTENENLLAFSILIQNFTGSAKTARNIQDKICNILAGHK